MGGIRQRLLAFCSVLVVFCTAQAAIAPRAFAVDVLNQCTDGTAQCAVCNNPNATQKPAICNDNQSGQSNPLLGQNGLLTAAIRILSLIVGIAAIIVIIISGLRIVISAGDSNSVSGARQSIIYALVGLAIAALAQLIVAFVLSKITP